MIIHNRLCTRSTYVRTHVGEHSEIDERLLVLVLVVLIGARVLAVFGGQPVGVQARQTRAHFRHAHQTRAEAGVGHGAHAHVRRRLRRCFQGDDVDGAETFADVVVARVVVTSDVGEWKFTGLPTSQQQVHDAKACFKL